MAQERNLNEYLMAEATEYEFKSALEIEKPKSWLKTVSAFANGVGGSIYFGVDDNGKLVGIDDIRKTTDKISEIIKERIEPSLIFSLEPIAVNGMKVLRLKVPNGANTPYYYFGDGNRIAFYRLGNQSVPATSDILFELTLKGKRQSFDSLDSGLNLTDYSFTLFEATYKERTGLKIDHAKDYSSFGMTIDSKLTYAGALFADQHAIYQSRIFCTRWNGLTKTSKFEADDDAEFEGNAIKLVDNALGFVRNNSSIKWHKTGRGRAEFPDYPQEAVYEALVNAIVHRDYVIKGSEIHIDIYDDRLEIVSPGGMADGKRIQDMTIESVASVRRNPVLCDIMHRLKFMERRGSGLNKIVEAYPVDITPEFKSTPQSFIVVLRNLNYGNEENKPQVKVQIKCKDCTLEEQAIIEFIAKNPQATQKEIAQAVGKSERKVHSAMICLQEKGIIERAGSKKVGTWAVKEQNKPQINRK